VLTLGQTLPLILGLNLDGVLIPHAGVRAMLLAVGVAVCIAGGSGIVSRSVRAASISPSHDSTRRLHLHTLNQVGAGSARDGGGVASDFEV
jgi:hypothetical protein